MSEKRVFKLTSGLPNANGDVFEPEGMRLGEGLERVFIHEHEETLIPKRFDDAEERQREMNRGWAALPFWSVAAVSAAIGLVALAAWLVL